MGQTVKFVNSRIISDTSRLHSRSVKRLRDGGRRAHAESQKICPAQRSRVEDRRYCAQTAQNSHNITQLIARNGAGKAWKTRLTRLCKNCHAICNMKIWRPQPYGKPCRRVSDRAESRARGPPGQPGSQGQEQGREGEERRM